MKDRLGVIKTARADGTQLEIYICNGGANQQRTLP
jgi:hypothetical protein